LSVGAIICCLKRRDRIQVAQDDNDIIINIELDDEDLNQVVSGVNPERMELDQPFPRFNPVAQGLGATSLQAFPAALKSGPTQTGR
jgi:hypothetical protein